MSAFLIAPSLTTALITDPTGGGAITVSDVNKVLVTKEWVEAQPTGEASQLELIDGAVDETGWRLLGAIPANYGTIGDKAVDFSQSTQTDPNGATGDYSFAEGQNTVASGDHSHAEGQGTKALGDQSHAEGFGTEAGPAGHPSGRLAQVGKGVLLPRKRV